MTEKSLGLIIRRFLGNA